MKRWRCSKCQFSCTVQTNEPDAVAPQTCLYDKGMAKQDWRRVQRQAKVQPMTWRHLYSSNNTAYGPLKRGNDIIANGVAERDGINICKAVNKEE